MPDYGKPINNNLHWKSTLDFFKEDVGEQPSTGGKEPAWKKHNPMWANNPEAENLNIENAKDDPKTDDTKTVTRTKKGGFVVIPIVKPETKEVKHGKGDFDYANTILSSLTKLMKEEELPDLEAWRDEFHPQNPDHPVSRYKKEHGGKLPPRMHIRNLGSHPETMPSEEDWEQPGIMSPDDLKETLGVAEGQDIQPEQQFNTEPYRPPTRETMSADMEYRDKAGMAPEDPPWKVDRTELSRPNVQNSIEKSLLKLMKGEPIEKVDARAIGRGIVGGLRGEKESPYMEGKTRGTPNYELLDPRTGEVEERPYSEQHTLIPFTGRGEEQYPQYRQGYRAGKGLRSVGEDLARFPRDVGREARRLGTEAKIGWEWGTDRQPGEMASATQEEHGVPPGAAARIGEVAGRVARSAFPTTREGLTNRTEPPPPKNSVENSLLKLMKDGDDQRFNAMADDKVKEQDDENILVADGDKTGDAMKRIAKEHTPEQEAKDIKIARLIRGRTARQEHNPDESPQVPEKPIGKAGKFGVSSFTQEELDQLKEDDKLAGRSARSAEYPQDPATANAPTNASTVLGIAEADKRQEPKIQSVEESLLKIMKQGDVTPAKVGMSRQNAMKNVEKYAQQGGGMGAAPTYRSADEIADANQQQFDDPSKWSAQSVADMIGRDVSNWMDRKADKGQPDYDSSQAHKTATQTQQQQQQQQQVKPVAPLV